MLPLIRMTWILNRRMLLQIAPVIALNLAVLLGLLGQGNPDAFLAGATGIVGLPLVIVLLQGLAGPGDEFLLALPVTPAQVVRARYLTSLLTLILGLALPLLAGMAAHDLVPAKVQLPAGEAITFLGLEALAYATAIFCFLPFVYAFGYAKGFILFACALALLVATALALKGAGGTLDLLVGLGYRALVNRSLALAFTVGVAVLGLASMGLSVWAYRRDLLASKRQAGQHKGWQLS